MVSTKPQKRSDFIERQVILYGEAYRKLIEDSLRWLSEREVVWGGIEIDREEFIRSLVQKAKVKK